MRKIFWVCIFLFLSRAAMAQDKYIDSLRDQLAVTKKPLERFDLVHKILENLFTGTVHKVDSASIMQLLQIAQDQKNDSLLAISYNWVGNYFSWTSDHNKALEYFLKGVPLAKKVNDKRRLSSLYIDISLIHKSIKNETDELRYINLARENLPDKSSPLYPFMDIQVKSLSAKYYLEHHKPDSALHYAQEAKEVNLVMKSIFFDAIVNVLLGNSYDQLGDSALADLYFKKALQAEGPAFFPFNSPKINYTSFLINHHLLAQARSMALYCLAGSREIKNNEMALVSAGYLQRIYHQMANADSAYYYSRLESDLRDTVFNQGKINRVQSMAFAEQLRIRDEELRDLAAEQERKREVQYLFISIGIISLVVLFLLLSHSIIVNEYVIKFIGIIGLLIVFEFINLLIHPFLENITHHSPIGMLLILVCLAALLIPLHHKLEKWITFKMVEKNKRIRLAAAKRVIKKLEPETPE